MKKNSMKVFAALLLAQIPAALWAQEDIVLRCESVDYATSGIQYEVGYLENILFIRKTIEGKEIARAELKKENFVSNYGGATILFQNSGKSGYLLIYYNRKNEGGSTTLIDINLFQPSVRELNTKGPSLGYSCERYEIDSLSKEMRRSP